MAIDVPAKLGIIGAGPAGLEAALYARFLGYDIVLWERDEPAHRIGELGNLPLGLFGELSSPLGRAALAAQSPDKKLPELITPMTAQAWWERYLAPLAESDLIVDSLHPKTTVIRASKEHLTGLELQGFERGGYDFLIETRAPDGATQSTSVDALIDASGLDSEIALPADYRFLSSLDLRLDPQSGLLPICPDYSDRLPDETQLTPESKQLIRFEPNFYLLGDKSSPTSKGIAFPAILNQIRALFTILGDRTSLDLYATAVTLPQ